MLAYFIDLLYSFARMSTLVVIHTGQIVFLMTLDEKTGENTMMVQNPYNGSSINIEPLLRLLAEQDEKFQLKVCKSMKNLHLEVMAKHGEAWYEELELLNKVVDMIVEI